MDLAYPKYLSSIKCFHVATNLTWTDQTLELLKIKRKIAFMDLFKSWYDCCANNQGDSGGALMVRGVLAGIVSRGGADNCAKVRHCYAGMYQTMEFVKYNFATIFSPNTWHTPLESNLWKVSSELGRSFWLVRLKSGSPGSPDSANYLAFSSKFGPRTQKLSRLHLQDINIENPFMIYMKFGFFKDIQLCIKKILLSIPPLRGPPNPTHPIPLYSTSVRHPSQDSIYYTGNGPMTLCKS